jgi:hypothetical protein
MPPTHTQWAISHYTVNFRKATWHGKHQSHTSSQPLRLKSNVLLTTLPYWPFKLQSHSWTPVHPMFQLRWIIWLLVMTWLFPTALLQVPASYSSWNTTSLTSLFSSPGKTKAASPNNYLSAPSLGGQVPCGNKGQAIINVSHVSQDTSIDQHY